jgi:hypothetical protein
MTQKDDEDRTSLDTDKVDRSRFLFNPIPIDIPRLDAPDFSDQLQSGAKSAAQIAREIKESEFGMLEARNFDFSAFINAGEAVQDGDFFFVIEAARLKQFATLLKGVAQSGPPQATATITIFNDRVKFAISSHTMFAEFLLKTVAPVAGVRDGQEVRLMVDQRVLVQISGDFCADIVISFRYIKETKTLEIKHGDIKLTIRTKEFDQSLFYHRYLKAEPSHRGKVVPTVLADAIRFLLPFARLDDGGGLQLGRHGIDLTTSKLTRSDGLPVGRAVCVDRIIGGIYESTELLAPDFHIEYAVTPMLQKALKLFHPDSTYFLRTGPWLLLRDQNFCFGFTGPDLRYRPADHILEEQAAERILANCGELTDALTKLSVAKIDRYLLVRFVIEGRGGDAALTLTTADRSGKISRAVLQISRRRIEISFDFPVLDFEIPLATFLETLKFAETANVLLEPLPKLLRVAVIKEDYQAAYGLFEHCGRA